MMTLSKLMLLAILALPLACSAKRARFDVCDEGSCQSDADCPDEAPSSGVLCGLDANSLCYYCPVGEAADTSVYECDNKVWKRRANQDCGSSEQ